ncbi:ABC transporter ATP-binding protein [Alginatibacterium sediminis]|uniref:ABC transporter ATP-binding protein n=1 Tax=Alginatibacterium sediminis TaxID=2164068 RepID=A0A420E692_9ALTE|nr:ABC transporter ATP-binding protein [Alginatibacterium sediminis]RKF12769.1 ABC transporter ATP-binding protein [Alginatibacterium sediminis]
MSVVPSVVNTLSWQQIRQQIFKHKPVLIKAHVIALLATLVSVPIPLMMPLLVDEVLLNQPGKAVDLMQQFLPQSWHGPTAYILFILAMVCCMRIAALILGVAQSRQFTIIGKQISFQIREQVLDFLPKVSLREYETQGAAAISARCVTDVETLDKFISVSLSKLLMSVMTIIGVAGILLWIDWTLGLIIIVLNPAVIYFSRSFGKRVKQLKRKENAAFEAFQLSLVETLDAINQLRTAQREQQYFARVSDAAQQLRDYSIESNWKTEAVERLSFTIFLLGFEIFRAIAMLMVVFSGLSVGEIFAVFGYLWFMMGPVQELLSMQYSFFGAQAAMSRLNELLALETEPFYPNKVNPFEQPEKGISVEIENVDFYYSKNKPLLKQVSMQIEAGQKAAIVSVSGGGKSTIVQLLLGLYQAQAGAIRYNRHSIEDIGYQCVRNNVATVLQQPILFNTTIRENLSMGNSFSDSEIWSALKLAELESTVRELKDQLNTRIGRNGVRLSGGQRQRLAIARMLLSDPKVVILDEATSALDTETEARILANLDSFLKGRTTLIIAHRLSAIQRADLIYVLDDGKMTQSGSHRDLIDTPGLYQTLYSN